MIVKSLNAGRHPHLREEVLQRKLHPFPCPACGKLLVIDSDFFWFDWHRKQFIGVFPAAMRTEPEMLKAEFLIAHSELLESGVVTVRLDRFLDDGSLVFLLEAKDGSLIGQPPIAIGAKRELYDALVPHREELLRERGAVVSGSHVSLRRVADAI